MSTFHEKLKRYKVLTKKQDEDFMIRLYAQQADSTENKDLRTAYESKLDEELAELEGGQKATKKVKAKAEEEAEPQEEENQGEGETEKESKKK
jgi:phage terminase Nu1 subunit (DNA packaging protein)